MATYQNIYRDAGIDTSIGDPTLATNDNVHLVEGSDSYTTELDQLAGVKLAQFAAFAGFEGNIGDTGAALQLDADLVELLWSGQHAYVAGVLTKTIGKLVHKPVNNGMLSLASATVTNLAVAGGTALVRSSVTATNLRCLGGTTGVEESATVTTLEAGGMNRQTVVNLRASLTTLNAYAGATVRALDIGITPTNLGLYGGTVAYQGGDITTVNVGPNGGVLDLRRLGQSIAVATWNVNGLLTILAPDSGVVAGWRPEDATSAFNNNCGVQPVIVYPAA